MDYALALVATLIGIIGGIPYIYDSYRKKTKPHRLAWIIFLVLSAISLASQFALGARLSLIFFSWFFINNLIIVSLSLRKNGGYGDVSKINVICGALAIASLILWYVTSSPLVALVCILFADGLGALLIVIKSYRHPYTETIIMWQLGILATGLNLLVIGKSDPAIWAAPVQVFLFNIAIVAAILLGKRRLRLKHKLA